MLFWGVPMGRVFGSVGCALVLAWGVCCSERSGGDTSAVETTVAEDSGRELRSAELSVDVVSVEVVDLRDEAIEVAVDVPSEADGAVVVEEVNLMVDTNRNGKAEPGDGDEEGEEKWSSHSGAVFIVNADDDDGDGVRDCDDEQLNGVLDAKDLAPLHIAAIPWMEKGWYGELTFDLGAEEHVRLFELEGNSWNPVDISAPVKVSEGKLRSGTVRYGLEGRHFAAELGFGGKVSVTFTLLDLDGNAVDSDSAELKVAPLILTSGHHPASEIQVAWSMPEQAGFVAELEFLIQGLTYDLKTVGEHGIALSIPIGGDIWMQDAVELGFTVLPDEPKPHVVHVALEAPRGKPLDQVGEDIFLGVDFGLADVAEPREDVYWFDWFGNLEVSSPLLHEEHYFPYGRLYTGFDPDGPDVWCMHPDVRAFLGAQEAQGPIVQVDTGWLLIGHVDEIISWIPWSGGPGCCGKGFIMLYASAAEGVELLEGLSADGHGDAVLFAGTGEEITVDEILGDELLMALNQTAQKRLDKTLKQLKEEFGLENEDIAIIPTLFEQDEQWGAYAVAMVPNMVNSLVLGKLLVAPDPHGPMIDGKDPFKEALVERLEPFSQIVEFVDNWYPYHVWNGEVHCGTNATRLPLNLEWWWM